MSFIQKVKCQNRSFSYTADLSLFDARNVTSQGLLRKTDRSGISKRGNLTYEIGSKSLYKGWNSKREKKDSNHRSEGSMTLSWSPQVCTSCCAVRIAVSHSQFWICQAGATFIRNGKSKGQKGYWCLPLLPLYQQPAIAAFPLLKAGNLFSFFLSPISAFY